MQNVHHTMPWYWEFSSRVIRKKFPSWLCRLLPLGDLEQDMFWCTFQLQNPLTFQSGPGISYLDSSWQSSLTSKGAPLLTSRMWHFLTILQQLPFAERPIFNSRHMSALPQVAPSFPKHALQRRHRASVNTPALHHGTVQTLRIGEYTWHCADIEHRWIHLP